MASNEDLKNMIYGFRVSELQDLLGFSGRNKTGKKQELQVRALGLLTLRSAPVQMKIVELYKKRYHQVGSSPANDRVNTAKGPLSTLPVPVNVPPMPRSSGSLVNSGGSNSNRANYSGLPYNAPSQLKTLPHLAALSDSYPVHPDVRLKSLPFYDILSVLLQPSSLSPSSSSTYQENHFNFHLTPQQVHEITSSRDYNQEYNVQIQLRFSMLETSCEQDDNFPPSICVKVNSKLCQLPNPIPTNHPGVEPKRPSRPVNITQLCRLSASISNGIVVSWASEYNRGYVVTVHLVRKLDSAVLLSRLRSGGIRNPDHTRAMIKEKLQQSPDSEIATTSLRGSLMCPIGKMRMQIPCRPITCTHLQCFDANLFLKMNEKKPRWICPVCDKPAMFKHLTIDGFFTEITSKVSAQCTEVQFHEDGSWTPIIKEKKAHDVEAGCSTSLDSMIPKKQANKRQKIEVVDLTIDSDSEDTWTLEMNSFFDSNRTTYSKKPGSDDRLKTESGVSSAATATYQPKVPTTAPFISLPSPPSPMTFDVDGSALPSISNLTKPSTSTAPSTSYSMDLSDIGKSSKGMVDFDLPARSSTNNHDEPICPSEANYLTTSSPYYAPIRTPPGGGDLSSTTQSYSNDNGLDFYSILNSDANSDLPLTSQGTSDVRNPPQSTTPDIISLD